jgi:hypothetical protein
MAATNSDSKGLLMRKNRFAVIDGDGHITERSKELLEYLGGNYRGTSTEEGWADTFSPFPSLDDWARLSGMGSPGQRDYPDCDTWVSFLDECGIQTTVVYPTAALAFGLIQDPAWAVDIERTYNSWLHVTHRVVGVILSAQWPTPPSKFLSLRDSKLTPPAKRLLSFRRNNTKHLANSAQLK